MPKAASASTYQRLIDDAYKLLYDCSDSPRIDAEVLLQHAIEKPLAWIIAYGDSVASNDHVTDFYLLIEQRQQGQPIAYITGHKEFWSMDLKVNESVLIPRPDTEILVEQALSLIPSDSAVQILDLGTGSGAIALAIAKERPACSVLAVDNQDDTLQVAKYNATHLAISNLRFLKSHWYAELAERQFDMIVSNPPYIEPDDEHLSKGDLRFEPSSALVGAGDGLDDIRNIIQCTPQHLKQDGHLIIEHGYNQASAVATLFSDVGFQAIVNAVDLNNLPRCTCGRWPN
ncbi:MAG: peptide chain release factor N(5)-glutamine methyltransferase [Acidiferrobacterales bacterium]|nr:peptide chain release factor N(5)-glutamine methyltransferase [Acidiferrobacterales bacterium]